MEPVTLLGIVAFVVTQTYFILRTMNNAKAKAEESSAAAQAANASQQEAITAQFTILSNENRRLQTRIDVLEAAAVVQAASVLAQEKELKQAQERAGRLEVEVGGLTNKVSVLETEKVMRVSELENERRQNEKQARELAATKAEVAGLQKRVSSLEGENAALRLILEKIQVVKVISEPEPDPDPPPTLHLEPKAA
jgi:chromosome segregation ATPase